MMRSIQHRGPDSAGIWHSKDNSLYLGHQRLAIQDLSSFGHQPMVSYSGRYVIVFNGEIYNFKRLSSDLSARGCVFKGHSDTEVILAAFDVWGVEASLSRLDGMFALAVYDSKNDELWLARDRMGEKPLYYAFIDGQLLFCSELKGILSSLERKMELNWRALGNYFRFGYLPVTDSPFQGIYKLSPAAFVRLRRSDISSANFEEFKYWKRPQLDALTLSISSSKLEHFDHVEKLLIDAVVDQSVADVPLGVFLSGGIDSTLVAALLQKHGQQRIKTYTIAFDSQEYNEAPFARQIAKHLGTDHLEIPLAVSDCLDVIDLLPELLDEPFADASFIPTYLVCREARKYVTVCLSGDGGDELFCGYNRYMQGDKLARLKKRMPGVLQRAIGRGLQSAPESVIEGLLSPLAYLNKSPGRKAEKDFGSKLHKLGKGLTAQTEAEMYAELLSFWSVSPLKDSRYFPEAISSLSQTFGGTIPFLEAAMNCDLDFYLVCDNLYKVDRAAMANSLEVRLPFLDRSVVEFAARLPAEYKIRGGKSKSILRDVLYRYVPSAMIERPKMGFSMPINTWLRSGLKQWADELIFDNEIMECAGLNDNVVRHAWNEHLTGRKDNANSLWTILIYLQWVRKNLSHIQQN